MILPLEKNPIKFVLEDRLRFTEKENMKINKDKSKIMLFNPSKNYQFPPEIGFNSNEQLEYVRKSKILGIVIMDNLKWSENTNYITDKAMSRIWTL